MFARRGRWNAAVEIFSEGRYFDAHEAFEELWRAAEGAEREFLQGWALLAAALFHRDRGNPKGARTCFERAAAHWGRVPPRFRGVDTAGTLAAVGRVLEQEWAAPDLAWISPDRRRVDRADSEADSP